MPFVAQRSRKIQIMSPPCVLSPSVGLNATKGHRPPAQNSKTTALLWPNAPGLRSFSHSIASSG